MNNAPAILQIKNVSRYFSRSSGFLAKAEPFKAVDDVTLALRQGATLGLVGESGSGKSTLARMAARLLQPSAGNIFLQGQPLFAERAEHKAQSAAARKDFLRRMPQELQMVFQDPYSSLNPRLKIGYSVAEPLACLGMPKKARVERVAELLLQVGLKADDAGRYPHEFSGGQRQRIAIARALAPQPAVLICDEAVSSLDASVQAQVLNLLKDRQEALGLSCIFISHDLTVVSHMSDEVAVMYMGQIVERAATDELFARPLHPYTRLLFEAGASHRRGACNAGGCAGTGAGLRPRQGWQRVRFCAALHPGRAGLLCAGACPAGVAGAFCALRPRCKLMFKGGAVCSKK